MDTMLGGFDFTFAYLDDIIISSKMRELHREQQNKVFSQIRELGFKVKEAKCDFCMNEIKYLGHIINKDGRRPDPERLQSSRICPPLIMLRYYRASLDLQITTKVSLKNLHDLRAPLNELLKKDKKWRWTLEC